MTDPRLARLDTQRRADAVAARAAATEGLVARLRELRTRNHFAERIEASMRPPAPREDPRR